MENSLLNGSLSLVLCLSLLFIVAVVIIIRININRSNNGKNRQRGKGNVQVVGTSNAAIENHGVINNYGLGSNNKEKLIKNDQGNVSVDDIKNRIQILFIDDKDDFKIIDILREIGYRVDYVPDIVDIDDNKIKNADIIFLDINGVGVAMKFKNQGMGLCGALRSRYGKDKKLILYSGETLGDIFDHDAKQADATLPKDSDLYQFISYITQYGKEVLSQTH